MAIQTAVYPFNEEWKKQTDHSSREWMEYCEARSVVRKYLEIRMDEGQEAAAKYRDDYLAEVAEARHSVALADKLYENAKLVLHFERQSLMPVPIH